MNVSTPDEMRKYGDDVIKLIDIAYAPIGGHVNYKTAEDVIADSDFWKLVRRNGRIILAVIYKLRNGRKSVAMGQDGSKEAKAELLKIIAEDIKHERCWAEVSGAAAKFFLRAGMPPVENKHAEQLLGKHILGLHGAYVYSRLIAGHAHRKVIVGYPGGQRYEVPGDYIDSIFKSLEH